MKPVTGLTQWGSTTTGTTVELDNNFSALKDAVNDLNTYSNYLLDSGAANAYVVTLGAGLTGTLTAGLKIQMKASASNTGASTLNYNGTGLLAIQTTGGAALSAGMIVSGGVYDLIYNGTVWQLQNPSAPSGMTLIAAKNSNGNSTIDFNAALTSSYDAYMLVGSNITVTGNQAGLYMRLGNGNANAGAYIATGYQWAARAQFTSSDGVDWGSTGNSVTTALVVALNGASGGMGNANSQSLGFVAHIMGPNANTRCPVEWSAQYTGFANTAVRAQGGGILDSQVAVTSVRVLSSNGNMPSGNFQLYGLTKV